MKNRLIHSRMHSRKYRTHQQNTPWRTIGSTRKFNSRWHQTRGNDYQWTDHYKYLHWYGRYNTEGSTQTRQQWWFHLCVYWGIRFELKKYSDDIHKWNIDVLSFNVVHSLLFYSSAVISSMCLRYSLNWKGSTHRFIRKVLAWPFLPAETFNTLKDTVDTEKITN
jgi:hypothetical protein